MSLPVTVFHKYQSLGNDFILLDATALQVESVVQQMADQSWNDRVEQLCDRYYSIGADGVVVVMQSGKNNFFAHVYNSDGSYGGFSGNGARAVAHYLWTTFRLSASFSYTMGNKVVDVLIDLTMSNESSGAVTTFIPTGTVGAERLVTIEGTELTGIEVDVGNPHLIFFEERTIPWLREHGTTLEFIKGAESPVNIEFITEQGDHQYRLLVHERGAGMTLACSSGAAAVTWLLYHEKKILAQQRCTLSMLGGSVVSWVTADQRIALQGEVACVFKGRVMGYADSL